MSVIPELSSDEVVQLLVEDFSDDSEVVLEIVKQCTSVDELEEIVKHGIEVLWCLGSFQEIEDFIQELKAKMKEGEICQ